MSHDIGTQQIYIDIDMDFKALSIHYLYIVITIVLAKEDVKVPLM
jgi:hypothetical protein